MTHGRGGRRASSSVARAGTTGLIGLLNPFRTTAVANDHVLFASFNLGSNVFFLGIRVSLSIDLSRVPVNATSHVIETILLGIAVPPFAHAQSRFIAADLLLFMALPTLLVTPTLIRSVVNVLVLKVALKIGLGRELYTFVWIALWTDVDQCLSILSNDGLNVIRCLRRSTDRVALHA
ncbi:MAG: hypothetical protein J3Q66DRAFT_345537 [Benniella sp.]|nr:MAG: hypothetical protein J3Q66DRAFT_345537 [Benniella sp.]